MLIKYKNTLYPAEGKTWYFKNSTLILKRNNNFINIEFNIPQHRILDFQTYFMSMVTDMINMGIKVIDVNFIEAEFFLDTT